jgi:hypothetical protein
MKKGESTERFAFPYYINPTMSNNCWRPTNANPPKYLYAIKPMIGEKSIIPKGGMNFLKIPKYGSTSLLMVSPTFDCENLGNHEPKMDIKINQ